MRKSQTFAISFALPMAADPDLHRHGCKLLRYIVEMPYDSRPYKSDARPLNRSFERRADFDLRAYAAQSFGVFQEEPVDVVLRVAPEAADKAACWLFHPSQTVTREADGGLRVAFRAGGTQEMCWHLFTWGTAITVIEPHDLRAELAGLAAAVARHHNVRRDQSVWQPGNVTITRALDRGDPE